MAGEARDRCLRIVLLGPPGCGKGTQAGFLADKLRVPTIATGDMLRGAVAEGSPLGNRVKDVMAAGALVEDSLMAEVVRERLAKPDAQDGYLLDGYPRTMSQAKTLEDILNGASSRLDRVVLFHVPEEVLVTRALARQRADDQEDVIRERLHVYRRQTEPLVGFYKDQGILSEVDGNREIRVIHEELLQILG